MANLLPMECRELLPNEFGEWNAFSAKHPLGSVYHSVEWTSAVERTYGHIRGRIFVIRDSRTGGIAAGMPVYHVRSRLLGDRLVTAPHATWCDPLVTSENQLHCLLDAVKRMGAELSIDRIEIRCRLLGDFSLPSAWSRSALWMHHGLNLSERSEELFDRLSLKSVRQLVRRAQQRKVTITAERGPNAVDVFQSALLETRKRIRLPMIPLSHFQNMDDILPDRAAAIYIARLGDRVLGAALTLTRNRRCHLELTGEHAGARAVGAMPLLIWTAIERAREADCLEFSFGRTSTTNIGLLRYKRNWATVEEDISVLHPASSPMSDSSRAMLRANNVLRVINGRVPRRFYEWIGRFVYGHWG